MSAPKCTSWLGHKFEARYSSEIGAPQKPLSLSDIGATSASEYTFAELFEINARQSEKRIYVHDICVRCGFAVEHKTAEGKQP